MKFSILFLTTIAALATAAPARNGGGRFRPGNGNPTNANPANGNVGNGNPANAAPPNAAPPPPTNTNVGAPPAASASAAPPANNGNNNNNNNQNGAVDPALIPDFGVTAGQNPDGTGNCTGDKGKIIPCQCPPDRASFIQKVTAAVAAGNSEGVPVSFPTGNDSASKKTRIQTAIVVLQNLESKGVGCPAASTTFLDQQTSA